MTEEQPPPFEAVSRRASILPSTFESEQNRQLELLGQDQQPSTSSTVPSAPPLEEEEELPSYEAGDGSATPPDYAERHLLEPVVSYNVYQINRKLQVLTPATRATFDRPRYRLTSRSGPSVFSKKADYTLTRLPTGDAGTASAAENCPGKDVGFINFDKGGTIPWMPRANVDILKDDDSTSGKRLSFPMSAPNFSDWKVLIDGRVFYWRLTDKPTAISLIEHSSNSIVGRFAYSAQGTDATRGEAVGVLDIFGGSRSEDTDIVELVLSTVQVPLIHWKNMGRHYKNDVTPRNCGILGPITLSGSRLSGPGDGRRRASNAV